MNLKEVKEYTEGLIKNYFKPKVLRKFDEDTNGNLTFDGDPISTKVSGKSDNAIEVVTDITTPANDGLYAKDLMPEIEAVDIKTDKLNIAQKTVNKVGTFPLLNDPIKFYGDNENTPSVTDIEDSVTLRDKVTNYDQVEILLKPSDPVNTHPQRTLVNTKDIVFNPEEYNIKDGSIINIRYGADTTTDVNTNLYDSYITAWMKNDRTMYFRELVNGLSKIAFDDSKDPTLYLDDFTSNNTSGIILKTDNFKNGTSSVYFPHAGANQLYLSRPDFVFNGDFTAQCWIYVYNDTDPYTLIFGDSNNSQFLFFITDGASGGNISLTQGTSRILNTGKKVTYNQWMHYVVERYNGVLRIYENGHIIGQTNYTGTCNMSNFAIGQNASSGNTKFHGYMDDLYVFNKAIYNGTDFNIATDIITDDPILKCEFESKPTIANSQEWTITEINGINKESVIIDPMNYIDTKQGIQDTPVGHIMSIMGNNAPEHYLKCDGTIYNKDDYPHLWEYFKKEFGTPNKFGGDGTTTFAVPDLQGEFLRGTGTNSYTNQGNGADVGVHQNATEIANVGIQNSSNGLYVYPNAWKSAENFDSITSTSTLTTGYNRMSASTTPAIPSFITTRPTNTSVLYVIKYEPTYFVGSINGHEEVTDLLTNPIEFNLSSSNTFNSINQSINIKDISNFDKLEIITEICTGGPWMYLKSKIIRKEDITYNTTNSYANGTILLNSVLGVVYAATLSVNIVNDTQIYIIDSVCNTANWTKMRIKQIRGIKSIYNVSNKTV